MMSQARAWDPQQTAIGGLQRFGRLVDNVLKADREGLVSAPAGGGDSGTSSGTNSGNASKQQLQVSSAQPMLQPQQEQLALVAPTEAQAAYQVEGGKSSPE